MASRPGVQRTSHRIIIRVPRGPCVADPDASDRLRLLNRVNRRLDHADRADVGGVLQRAFKLVGETNHRRRANVRACGNELRDIGPAQCAVLHLDPGEVVMRRHLAVQLRVGLTDAERSQLFAVEQFLFCCIPQRLVRRPTERVLQIVFRGPTLRAIIRRDIRRTRARCRSR